MLSTSPSSQSPKLVHLNVCSSSILNIYFFDQESFQIKENNYYERLIRSFLKEIKFKIMANFHLCFGNAELGFLANSAKKTDFFSPQI